MSLQSLLERKSQVQTNLTTNQSYLTASDVAMSRISEMVADIRGATLSVIGTIANDDQRNAAAQQVGEAVRQLMDAGNQKFRGRFLFAGSTTLVRPFEKVGNNAIQYVGNENQLLSYSDVDLLFASNVNGNDVFGAISEPVRGSVDLNPVVTFNTRLDDLRQGQGISRGSISISANIGGVTETSTVDLSSAATVGDVALMIHDNPPSGVGIDVDITPTGLVLQLNSAVPGLLSVQEVGGGTTASELGILNAAGVMAAPLTGRDLDPILRGTTRLDDAFGARAQAAIRSPGIENDIIIEADVRGSALNGVTVHFTDNPLLSAGNEIVTYDPAAGRIDVQIDENFTQAGHVVQAINDFQALGGVPFTARLDPLEAGPNAGTGQIPVTPLGQAAGTTAHGAGVEFDQASGLQIVNGDETYALDISSATTVEDLLNLLNGSGAHLLAEINASRTGIDVRSRLSGADFSIGENGGQTATQLGIRTLVDQTRLDDMNFGLGVMDYQGDGMKAVANFRSVGGNSDLVFRARQDGPDWNDFTINLIDSGGGAGSETVAWDPAAKTITLAVAPGVTTANRLVEVFQQNPGPRDNFEIDLDDADGGPNTGSGFVFTGSTTTSGGHGGGTDFTITRADGVILEIDIAGAGNVLEVRNAINNHVDNADGRLVARLAQYGNGIELVDNSLGTGQPGVARTMLSTTAIDLGLVAQGTQSTSPTTPGTVAGATVASTGVNNDLIFQGATPGTYPNGIEVVFVDPGTAVEAFSYNPVAGTLQFDIIAGVTDANRIIQLLDADPVASQLFSAALDPSDGNDGTGFVEVTNPATPSILAGGLPAVITGADVNRTETEGLFTGLLRLQNALMTNDNVQVQRAVDLLDRAMVNMNFTRADLGAKQQGLDVLEDRLGAEEIELREVLSLEHDTDIVEVISNLSARQMALEAGLQASARMLDMTLLDYL
jgi:flagellin-like hook-associated protein FlgL